MGKNQTGLQKFLNPPKWMGLFLKIECVGIFIALMINGYMPHWAAIFALAWTIGTAIVLAFINAILAFGFGVLLVISWFGLALILGAIDRYVAEETGIDYETWLWIGSFLFIYGAFVLNHFLGWFDKYTHPYTPWHK